MPANNAFEDAIDEIEAAYVTLEHKLGWRFLAVSKDVLQQNPQIALITANPGGNAIRPDHGTASCENGCAYLSECWSDAAKGESKLQKQVKQLFVDIAKQVNFVDGGAALMERSLIGYFIPFRSPRLTLLPRKKESLSFAQSLWSRLFKHVQPTLIITIDRDAFKAVGEILQQKFPTHVRQHHVMQTGWGKVRAEIVHFHHKDEVTTIVRLPHLSTFQLFARPACRPFIDSILSNACAYLKK